MIEQELFDYLKLNVYPDLVMSTSPISRWDCYSVTKQHRIELKCRKTHYDELVIEKSKFAALLDKAIDNWDAPIYINSTPKGIYRWNLFFTNPHWFFKDLPETTDFAKRKKISKEIAMLPVYDAEIL